MLRARQATNALLVPTDATGVSMLFKNLKKGGVSIVLPDHVPEKNGGVDVPLFGLITPTTTLVSKLAGKVGCPVVSLCCIRNEDGLYDVHCAQVDAKIYDADVAVATTALNHHVQSMCQQFMTHYIWSYKRFKRNVQFTSLYNQPLAQALAQVRAIQSA
jgi:KDO2-lipid IV(A) lauroyltransferase